MYDVDYEYISENMSELSRIPIRIYENGHFVKLFSPFPIFADPVILHLDKILSIEKSISYYITPYYQYYGVVQHQDHTFVIGPTSQIPLSRADARELMFLLGIKENQREHFHNMLRSITPMPLQLFLHMLCMLNYYLNGEKKEVSEILLFDSSSGISLRELEEVESLPGNYESDLPGTVAHTSFEFETKMISYVKNGDMDGLLSFFSHASPGQSGKIGENYLRQLKNIFIVTATLVSRAAIAGGLPAEEALTLSDDYIRHSEKYMTPEHINNLQHHMVLDYTSQVYDLNHGKGYSKVIRDTITYLRDHITENIRIEVLAEHVFLSRSQLSVRFKDETGMTITEYIRNLKIKKAQEFLSSTEKTPLEISTYLGFSSQSHFQKVFKELTGMTPKEYREK